MNLARLSSGFLFHVVFSTIVAFILLFIFQKISPTLSILSLMMGTMIAVSILPKIKFRSSFELSKTSLVDRVVGLFLIWALFRLFMYNIYYDADSIKTLLPNNLGDLPFHLSQIASFQEGPFPFLNPSFVGEYFRYPFGVNLYSSLWDSLGVPIHTNFFIFGFACSVVLLLFLYDQGKWLAWVCLLLGGGSVGYQFLSDGLWINHQDQIPWKNFLTSMWIPQRGLLIGLPIGLTILNFTMRSVEDRNQFTIFDYKLIGFLWGILPFFHTHSFVFISLFLAVLLLRPNRWPLFLNMFKFALIPAACWMLFVTEFFTGSGKLSFQVGWQGSLDNPLVFWFKNLGGVLILFVISALFAWRSPERKERLELFVIFMGFFIFFQFVIFSKWDWDNLKLLIWPVIGLSGLAWRCFVSKLNVNVQLILALTIGFTGFVSTVASMNGQRKGIEIYDKKEIYKVRELVKGIDKQERILALPTFNHALGFLGYKLVMGYDGHLWSHGVDFKKEKDAIDSIYNFKDDFDNAVDLVDAKFVLFSKRESAAFGLDSDAFTEKMLQNGYLVRSRVDDALLFEAKSK